jgi:hypothetical protein
MSYLNGNIPLIPQNIFVHKILTIRGEIKWKRSIQVLGLSVAFW